MGGCANCGAENKVDARFCKSCGTNLAEVKVEANGCHSCHAELPLNSKFCKKCGTPVPVVAAKGVESAAPTVVNEAPAALTPAVKVESITGQAEGVPIIAAQTIASNISTPPVETPPLAEQTSAGKSIPPAIRARSDTKSSSGRSIHVIVAVGVLTVVLAGGGGFYWWSAKKHVTEVQATQTKDAPAPLIATEPEQAGAVKSSASLSEASSTATATLAHEAAPSPATEASSATGQVVAPTKPITASEPIAHTPKPPPKVAAAVSPKPADTPTPLSTKRAEAVFPASANANRSDPIASKVSALLSKADSYIASRQYDKAIATAESALELDPSSSGAKAMIGKAKSRQMEALKSGSSLE